MIDINTALQNILKAIYGKDVRQSIHDAIYQINQNANEAVDLAQIKFGVDVTEPTSPVGTYLEGTVYFNVQTGIIWKLAGGSWAQLGTMKTIDRIEKISTVGLEDTYEVIYNDGTTSEYKVTNGISVSDIRKASTTGNVDHYEVLLTNGAKTPNGFDVTNGLNGVSVADVVLDSAVGVTKNYKMALSDGTRTPNGFSVSDGVSSYVHVRYSASFDGQGMVTVPTDQTVYIGICVTTQNTAPTDPAVYSWVRFIGKSGTGSGDMLASDYSTIYKNVVDKAVALYDGTEETSANQLMKKSEYATNGIAGTVDQAAGLVDIVNSKVADVAVLAKLSEADGKLQYNGKTIDVDVDDETITKNESGELTLTEEVSNKIATVDGIAGGDEWTARTYTKGETCIHNNIVWLCLADTNTEPSASDTSHWQQISLKSLNNTLGGLQYANLSGNVTTKTGNATVRELTKSANTYVFNFRVDGVSVSSKSWVNLFEMDGNVPKPTTATSYMVGVQMDTSIFVTRAILNPNGILEIYGSTTLSSATVFGTIIWQK